MEVMYFRLVGMNQNPITYSESNLFKDLFSFLVSASNPRPLPGKELNLLILGLRHYPNKL